MSIWTQVFVTIEYERPCWLEDGKSWKLPNFGKKAIWEDGIKNEDWLRATRECNIPLGSEGSLNYTIKRVGKDTAFAIIWGGLRDYRNYKEVIQYLNRIVARESGVFSIRKGYGYITKTRQENRPIELVYDIEQNKDEWKWVKNGR